MEDPRDSILTRPFSKILCQLFRLGTLTLGRRNLLETGRFFCFLCRNYSKIRTYTFAVCKDRRINGEY